jgi:predicted ABC-type ATPase
VPSLILITGPNGAGKTTFASEYLSTEEQRFEFVNADEIAHELGQERSTQGRSDIRAGRMMLERIDKLIASKADFVIETTLASLGYARKIPAWRERGYSVSLIYLRLASVDESMLRVGKRVAAGGHDIPENVIRRRFGKCLAYFETTYKPIVDAWHLWERLEGSFVLLVAWDRR